MFILIDHKENENKDTKVENTSEEPNTVKKPAERAFNRKNFKDRKNFRNNKRKPNFKRNDEFEERIVNIARVTNVVKGGRRFSFSVLAIIGDKKGKVGCGHGKANEVPDAIKKAIKNAKGKLIEVPIINGRTIPHEITSKYISSKVMLKPASKGRGIIASGAVRSVVELAGYKDIVTKSLGSSNKINVVKATIESLKKLRTVEEIAKIRDKKVEEILT